MANLAADNIANSTSVDREFIVTRVVNAPRALVWKAWTEPAHIVRWWGGDGCRATNGSVDLRVGGAFSLSLTIPDGSTVRCGGVFREIIRPERLVLDGDADEGRSPCGAGLPPGARVTVTFEDTGGEVGSKTKLTIVTRFPTDAAFAGALESGYDRGWPECLDRLATHVGKIEN